MMEESLMHSYNQHHHHVHHQQYPHHHQQQQMHNPVHKMMSRDCRSDLEFSAMMLDDMTARLQTMVKNEPPFPQHYLGNPAFDHPNNRLHHPIPPVWPESDTAWIYFQVRRISLFCTKRFSALRTKRLLRHVYHVLLDCTVFQHYGYVVCECFLSWMIHFVYALFFNSLVYGSKSRHVHFQHYRDVNVSSLELFTSSTRYS